MAETDEARRIGLCASCVHARRVESDRGRVSGFGIANPERKSVFWLCQLSKTDPRFPKYPRLPVIECGGYATSAANRQDTNRERTQPLTAAEVLQRYTEEELPEFIGVVLKDVNQPGNSGIGLFTWQAFGVIWKKLQRYWTAGLTLTHEGAWGTRLGMRPPGKARLQ